MWEQACVVGRLTKMRDLVTFSKSTLYIMNRIEASVRLQGITTTRSYKFGENAQAETTVTLKMATLFMLCCWILFRDINIIQTFTY